jgi:signal peptidase I
MSGERRGLGARLGIAALNLPWPGLGLLRLGDNRLAVRFIVLPFLLLLGLLAWYSVGPELTFGSWAALMLLLLTGHFGAIVGAAASGWRRSAERRPIERWWSRWYGIVVAWLAAIGLTNALPDLQTYYRNFYVPSTAMEPTLMRNDRFVARMRNLGPIERGQIVLVSAPRGGIYVERVAALPGDRIAMVDGTVVLNGRPVPQRLVGVEERRESGMAGPRRRLTERFPGERGEHEIYDAGATSIDDFAETLVQPGHVFVLGDNRDMSADSRLTAGMGGLEQVPVGNVIGRPLFFSWWPGRGNSGRPIAD